MTAPYAGYQQNLAYSAAKDRMIIGAGMARKQMAPADGVIWSAKVGYNFQIAMNGLNVTIDPGVALVAGYKVVGPASTAITITAGGGTARRDLIILRVWDTEAGDASSQVTVEKVQGTSASDPPIPARSLVLWALDIAAGASTIGGWTDRRIYAVAAGGTRQVSKIGDIAADDIAHGTMAYDVGTQRLWRRDGSQLTPMSKQIGPNTGPDFFSCWNVGNFDSNGLWYASWSAMGVTWSSTPAVSAMVSVFSTGGGQVPVHLQTYKPHNSASTLVLQANYVQAGDVFRGAIDLCLIAMGQFA